MTLPAANQPISFEDINEELGRSSNAQLDLQYASEQFSLTAPHGMDELAGLTFNTFTFDTAQVTEWGVSTTGVITPPTLGGPGTITSITYVGSISNTSYAQVSSDTTRTANIIVQAPATGYGNNNALVSGSKTTIQPDNNFDIADAGVTTSINSDGTINVNLSEGTLNSISPSSFNAADSGELSYRVYVNIPSGYSNYPGTVYGDYTRTKTAASRTLSLTSDASNNTTDGNDQYVALYVTDDNYSDTSWTIAAVGTPTLSNYSLSPTSGTGTTTVGLSFDKNQNGVSGAQRQGTFQVTGPANAPSITIRQNSAASAPTVTISDPTSNFAYNDTTTVQTLTGTITGGDPATSAVFINYSSDFEFVQTQSDVTIDVSGVTANVASSALSSRNTFTIGVKATGDNDSTTTPKTALIQFRADNASPGTAASTTVTQNFNVTWNTNLSSLSFPAAGDTLTVVLNSSVSWTASVSGTGYSINTTSGGSGTHNISVFKTASDLGGNGSVTFSASGQSDIVVSLSQAAAPLEFYYYVNGNSTGETTTPRSLGTFSYLGESMSIGVYAYRGSTASSTPFNLQKGNAVSGYGVGTTTSNTSSTFTSVVNTGQGTGNSATELYINASSNSGNSSTRTINVELYIDGTSEVTFTATQAADPNAGSGGGGGTPPREDIE